jgi:polysaccharide deacetylase 2 family uncharacterized protein YibQ
VSATATAGANRRGWQLLGLFWLVVVLASGGLFGTLAVMGPPAPPTVAELAPAPQQLPEPAPAPVAEAPPPPAPEPSPGTIPAADPALLEAGPFGPVPRIAVDGRTSIRFYARPGPGRTETRPRIALVVGGLGMNATLSEQAIDRLPAQATLAINPYAPRPGGLLDRARGRGMEFLVSLPLEPNGYPANDPGDRALLTRLSPAQNEERLLWVLSRFQGYVGAVGALGPLRGERFAALSEPFGTLQDHLRRRGLLFLDARPGARNPDRAWGRTVDVVVDEPATRTEIDMKLGALERLARERGSAMGLIGDPTPVLVDRVEAWSRSLEERGAVLVPASSLIRRPEVTP